MLFSPRCSSAVALAAAALALAAPAAAGAAASAAERPPGRPLSAPVASGSPAPRAHVAGDPVVSCDDSAASIGWDPGNRIHAGGWMSCTRPLPQVPRTVDATLTQDGRAVAYNRSECSGFGGVCSVQTPDVGNPPGIQHWCSTSVAVYATYHRTSQECWNG